MILFLTVLAALILGILMAVYLRRKVFIMGGFFLIFFISNLAMSWPYFTEDPATWHITYLTGLAYGLASIVFHIIPALIAYFATRWFLRIKCTLCN